MAILDMLKKRTEQKEPPKFVKDGYEICVLCGQITSVRYETPVSERRFYIEGCGQLCEKCFAEMRATTHKEVEGSQKQKASLLDSLANEAECSVLSDLHFLSGTQRMLLVDQLNTISPEAHTLWEWNDALQYLTGCPPEKSAALAKEKLVMLLKQRKLRASKNSILRRV